MRTITIEVPEELVCAVEARGGHLAGLMEQALRKWIPAHDRFLDILAQIDSLDPPFTQDEIDEELATWKAEKAEARERANRS